MVQSDSESQLAHALVELVEDGEVPVNSVVLGDELKQRHFNIAENDVITGLKSSAIISRVVIELEVVSFPLGTLTQSVELLLGTLDDVVANLEHGSLVLEVLEDLSVHLEAHFEHLSKDWVQTRVEDPSLVLRQVLLEDRSIIHCKLPLQL